MGINKVNESKAKIKTLLLVQIVNLGEVKRHLTYAYSKLKLDCFKQMHVQEAFPFASFGTFH